MTRLEQLEAIALQAEARCHGFLDLLDERIAVNSPRELTACEQQVFSMVKREAHLARVAVQFYCAGLRDGKEGRKPSQLARLISGFPGWGNLYREGYETGLICRE